MVVTLYPKRPGDSDEALCEWCGRPGEVLPVKVTGGEFEVCQPSLCEVCQGFLGISHPHRGQRANSRQESESQQLAQWVEARHAVWRLLDERYRAEGRPSPPWESPSPS
jgi:ribosome-binding protein aMBF1 (putative translation factor)